MKVQTDIALRTCAGPGDLGEDHFSAREKLRSEDLEAKLREMRIVVSVVALGVHSNLRWLSRDEPDIEAARCTSAKLVEQINRLEYLLKELAER
ncbi:hypothetical protein ACI2KT_33920 [Ensifer adhaerens]|uniref:hypothetical protein n=1 Tax=Ensifer TaxID=106591 RepID=UPI0017856EA3|nr:hypothetical protein [Ensifer sp. ENS08]MBD9573618.1 hypothetical protein [Ensifer sp. ENS08]